MEFFKFLGCLLTGLGLGYGCGGNSEKIRTFGWLTMAVGGLILAYLEKIYGIKW